MPQAPKRFILAVTGASGMPYAIRLAEILSRNAELHCMVSEAAKKVLRLESDLTADHFKSLAAQTYPEDRIEAGPASGTWRHDGMVICPCSMATLAGVANGLGNTLILRAADVALKEGRKLILVPRETPLSLIHLKNMVAAREAGAIILPACPGFYHRPTNLAGIVDHVVARICDQLNIDHGLVPSWQNPQE